MDPIADIPIEPDIRLGSLALKAGAITPEQLREALGAQAREATDGKLPRQIGIILLTKGYLSPEQLSKLLQDQQVLRRPR